MKIMKAIAGGAVLNRLQDNNGVEGQTIHVGGQGFSGNENVDIYFGGDLITTATAQGGSFGQPGSDFDITVPSPHIHGPVNILAKGQTSGLYAVDVFNVRSENPVDLWIYDQWDPSTWASYPGSHPTWDNPDIQLYDQNNNPVGSANLIVGNNYNVKMSFHNDTAFNAPQADVVLRWADFGMGSPWNHVGDAKLDVPPGGAVAEIPFVPPITGHLCINAEIHHLEDINPNNNMAQENLHVGGTSSPAKVCFVLHNPTDVPSPIFMEVRQLFKKGQNKERLWATWIEHPDPQEVEPRGHTKACVIVDPDIADAKVGTMAEFAVTAFIGSKMIGGINLKITKQPPV
jgi:hypothetical protein